jgi:hypothetical protein
MVASCRRLLHYNTIKKKTKKMKKGRELTFKFPLYLLTFGYCFKRIVLTTTSTLPFLASTFALLLLATTSAFPLLAITFGFPLLVPSSTLPLLPSHFKLSRTLTKERAQNEMKSVGRK